MKEYEDIGRQMVRHENELMNHRLTWLLTLEGLLFAGLGFAWGKGDVENTRGLIVVFCLVGGGVPVFTWFILNAAQMALRRLRDWWAAYRPEEGYDGPEIFGYWHDQQYISWLMPWRVIPGAFVLAWTAVFILNWARPHATEPAGDPSDTRILQHTPSLSPDELGQVRFEAAFDANYSPGTIQYALYNPSRSKSIRGIVIKIHSEKLNIAQLSATELFIDLRCGPLQCANGQKTFGPLVEPSKDASVIYLKEAHYEHD